jgi:transglutaminase-like putative cysteine protease
MAPVQAPVEPPAEEWPEEAPQISDDLPSNAPQQEEPVAEFEEQPPEYAQEQYAPPPVRAPRTDQRLYQGYQRSQAATQAGAMRRTDGYDSSRRAAVEAYRRRKEQQGMGTPQYGAVRVARRADDAPAQGPGYETEEQARKRRFARQKNKWGVAKGVTVIVVLFILFMLPITQNIMPEARDVLMANLTEPSPRLFPATAEYKMQRTFGLTIAAGTVTYDLKVPVPYNVQGAQEMIEFSASPAGTKSGTDMLWNGETDHTIQIIVSYHFKATTVKWSVTPETSGTTKDVPAEYQKYLGDEWKITPSDPNIKTRAEQIAGSKTTVYEKLDALAEWMRENILYEKERGWQPKDPLETLSDGTGDCDDQSILFASMARAQGIPVWLEMGALFDEFQNKWGGHAWLKAYIPLRGGGGVKINMDPANKEFMVRDPFRITEWEGTGNGDDLQNYYTLWQFSYSGDADYSASANYINLEYKRSSSTVSDKPAGSGEQTWKDSYKMPGFEFLALIPALGVALVLTRRKMKKN